MKDKKEKTLIKGVIFDEDGNGDCYFGHCSYKEHENYVVGLETNRSYKPFVWRYCPICKIKWCLGNMVSAGKGNKSDFEDYQDFTDKMINIKDLGKVIK